MITDDLSREAFVRLLKIAKGDTGQSSRAANFVLAWWNAGSCGGFDLIDMCSCDVAIAADMRKVFGYVASLPMPAYPDEHRADIEAVIDRHRPHLVDERARLLRAHAAVQRADTELQDAASNFVKVGGEVEWIDAGKRLKGRVITAAGFKYLVRRHGEEPVSVHLRELLAALRGDDE